MNKNFFALLLTFIIAGNMSAQDVSRGELLKTLNDVNDIGLNNKETEDLKHFNETMTDNLFGIVRGGESDEKKRSSLLSLKKDSKSGLLDILGEDHFDKYQKKMKRTLRPYKRKMKLLKLAL